MKGDQLTRQPKGHLHIMSATAWGFSKAIFTLHIESGQVPQQHTESPEA